METLRVDAKAPKKPEVIKIALTLANSEIVVLPTETVYTFAADATDERVVKKVYALKGRNFKKPLHVVVADIDMAKKYVKVSEAALKLTEKFLPGPLTLVLLKRSGVLPKLLTAGLPTLGVRIPALPLNLLVAEKLTKPYTTTSANLSGGPNPYSVATVLGQFSESKRKMISLVVDTGQLPSIAPSTVLDLTQEPPRILRQGPITRAQIEEVLGYKIVARL